MARRKLIQAEREAAVKAAAEAETAAEEARKKERASFLKGLLVNGTIIGGYEFFRGGALNAALQWICEKREQFGMIQPTDDGITAATFCKQYLRDRKAAIDSLKAEKENALKDDKKLGAAGTLEALQTGTVEGLDLYTGFKLCPFENKEKIYRSALTVITENPKTKQKESTMQLVEAKFDGKKLKQINCYEATPDGKGRLLATYVSNGDALSTIKIPNPDYKPKSSVPTPTELEINVLKDLSSDSKMNNYKKFHTEIYGKIMLSITSCADKESEMEGRKAAESAVQKGSQPFPSRQPVDQATR